MDINKMAELYKKIEKGIASDDEKQRFDTQLKICCCTKESIMERIKQINNGN